VAWNRSECISISSESVARIISALVREGDVIRTEEPRSICPSRLMEEAAVPDASLKLELSRKNEIA
jgi:hypothetical protein